MGFSEIKIGGVVPFRNTQDVRVAFHGYERGCVVIEVLRHSLCFY